MSCPCIIDLEIVEDPCFDLPTEEAIVLRTTDDYNELQNRPKINGVLLEGNRTSADLHIDQTYTHVQAQASDRWVIIHGLHKCPSITVVDSAGTVVVGALQYIDENTIVCSFSGAFSGKAYLN